MKKSSMFTIMAFVILLYGTSFAKAITRHQVVQPLNQKDWTFMVYLDGDCNLEIYQVNAFSMMASVGSTADVNVLVQFDRIPGYDPRYGDWTDCRRFYVTPGMTPTADNALYSLGETNVGVPLNLVDFILWGINEYPAEKYALVLSDHGDNGGVCVDDTSNYDYLNCAELYEAMQTVHNSTEIVVDLIGLEGCLMSAVEVAYHFADVAEVIVASEERCADFPYDRILSGLATSPTMDSVTLAQTFASCFSQHHHNTFDWASLSAFNLTTVAKKVIPAVDALASSLNQTLKTYCHDILAAMGDTEYAFTRGNYSAGDLYYFAQNAMQCISDLQVRAAAQEVVRAIRAARIAEWHGSLHQDYYGLSIYLPPTVDAYNSRTSLYSFDNMRWVMNSVWDDFLYTMFVTYASGVRSRESLSDVSYALFDSDDDDYFDAVHVKLDADTTGEAISVSVHASLIDPLNNVVDVDVAWTNASSQDEWCDLYVYMPVEGEEGWCDIELLLYDECGIYEDRLYSDDVAYLPAYKDWNPADINRDLKVDIYDIVLVADAYDSTPSDPRWNPQADIAAPWEIIDIYDVVLACNSYGEKYAP